MEKAKNICMTASFLVMIIICTIQSERVKNEETFVRGFFSILMLSAFTANSYTLGKNTIRPKDGKESPGARLKKNIKAPSWRIMNM